MKIVNMRSVCFTLNNYTVGQYKRLMKDDRFSYIIIGKEVGESGTPHLQGYFELILQTRQETVQKWYKNKWHIEPRYGSQRKAIKYCKKDGNWAERGERRIQGRRGDLDIARHDAVMSGLRFVSEYGSLQQIRVSQIYLTYNEPGRDWKPIVRWLYGISGAGKSQLARELAKKFGADVKQTYTKNTPNKWWPGYDAHPVVIIDDLKCHWQDWNLGYLLGLVDRYEFRVEYKGGERQFRARLIIITCINPPEDEFHDPEGELQRRIDFVTEVKGNTGALD